MFGKRKAEVLVVGAGPVGLFAALELASKGVRVRIMDEEWKTTARSYALALHPSSLEYLHEAGLAERLVEDGRRLHALALCDSRGPRHKIEFAKLDSPYPFVLVLPQRSLEAALVEALKEQDVKVDWNHRVERLDLGEKKVKAVVQRLSKEGSGYSVSSMEWYVDKTIEAEYDFVIGADGHKSIVRRSLGIEYRDFGLPEVFAVFEFKADRAGENEVQVVLQDGFTSVCWPLDDHAFRWSFQLRSDEEIVDPRRKSRLAVQVGGRSYPHLDRERLSDLIEERAPWFQPRAEEMFWSLAVRFERRLAESFGAGRAWLTGDAAHLASPVGVHSMNVGLCEASQLSAMMAGALRHGDPFAEMVPGESMRASRPSMEQHARRCFDDWERMLSIDKMPSVADDASPWIRERAARIPSCVPASGEHLKSLLGQIGLGIPKREAKA